MARHQFDFAVNANFPADKPLYPQLQSGFFCLFWPAALDQQDRRILAVLARCSNRCSISRSHFGLLLRDAFKILRPHAAPIDDKQVFFRSGDKYVVAGTIDTRGPSRRIWLPAFWTSIWARALAAWQNLGDSNNPPIFERPLVPAPFRPVPYRGRRAARKLPGRCPGPGLPA